VLVAISTNNILGVIHVVHLNINLFVYYKDFKEKIQSVGGVMLKGYEDRLGIDKEQLNY